MIETLDCTFRDGGYVNDWHFDKKIAREAYRSLSKAGVDIVELGYKNPIGSLPADDSGIWRFCPRELIEETIEGIQGARIALMINYGKVSLNDIEERGTGPVSLLRVAAHKDKIKDALEFARGLKKKEYEVSLNLMGFTGYNEAERKAVVDILKREDIDYLYIADSYGSMLPNQIEGIFRPLIEGLGNIKMGFHPHNNLQMAFANTIEAIRCGVHIVDGSMYGIGRSAGNLPIEILISYLELSTDRKYNVVPILNVIDRYFAPLKEEKSWGYELPFMLSGILSCHPNYAKELIKRHEYAIEDVWDLLHEIKKINPIGFSKERLNEVIKKGGFIRDAERAVRDSKEDHNQLPYVVDRDVPYKDRHKDRDFLILANGPSLKESKEDIDRFIKEYDPVILGGNFLGDLFLPHYHAFNNKRRFLDYIDTVNKDSKLLLSKYLPAQMLRDYVIRDYEFIYYKDEPSSFDIANSVIQSNCRTISVLLIGIAIVMGARRIFIAGMDGYNILQEKTSTHFYNEKDETTDLEIVREKHDTNLKYLKEIDEYLVSKKREGIHIITPTNYKPFYKGIKNYIGAA